MAQDFSLLVKHLERVANQKATFHIGWEDAGQAQVAKELYFGSAKMGLGPTEWGGHKKWMSVSGWPARPFLRDAWNIRRDEARAAVKEFFEDSMRDNADYAKTGRKLVAVVQGFLENDTWIYQPNALHVSEDKDYKAPLNDYGTMKDTLTFGVE